MKTNNFKYLDVLGMIWISVLIFSSLVAQKIVRIQGLDISVVMIGYPLTYIFSDIFTEVYGYKQSRRIVWTGFGCLALVALLSSLYAYIAPSPLYENEVGFDSIFKASPYMSAITIITFFCGEFANSFTLAKMKVWMSGRHLWMRTVGSTILGSTIDNGGFFVLFGLYFGLSWSEIALTAITAIVFQICYEALATPVTYRIIGFLKYTEGIDTYDAHTNFNPFSLSTNYESRDVLQRS